MSRKLIAGQNLECRIFLIRGLRVMLDRDLAELYQVPTKVLNQAVKRHIKRFPRDFMFQLSGVERQNWRSQIVTSNPGTKMGLRRSPYAFTEQGIAMLSSVLNSERAIDVNIAIMRAFVQLREMISSHKELAKKLDALERRIKSHDHKIEAVFDAIRELMNPPEKPHSIIGFKP